jgi:hypothetical protein
MKSPRDSHSAPPLQSNGKTERGYGILLNQPSWHATGVINDIPNSSRVSQLRIPSSVRDLSTRPTDATSPDTVRALELALREVLDNVKAATWVFSLPSTRSFVRQLEHPSLT